MIGNIQESSMRYYVENFEVRSGMNEHSPKIGKGIWYTLVTQ